MANQISKYVSNEKGATAVEYVLIIAGIAVVLITAIGLFGTGLTNKINELTNSLFGAQGDGG